MRLARVRTLRNPSSAEYGALYPQVYWVFGGDGAAPFGDAAVAPARQPWTAEPEL